MSTTDRAPAGGRSRTSGSPAARLDDVAELADVSRITASRVFSGAAPVSDRAREAVQRAAEQLHYVPNRAARALATGRNDMVGLVLARSIPDVFADPFFADMTQELNRYLADQDQQLLLLLAETDADRRRIVQLGRARQLDGFLVFQAHGSNPLPRMLHDVGAPLVLGGRPLDPDLPVAYVDFANEQAAHEATSHLVRRGHRRIACVSGPQDHCAGADRLAGYRRALVEAGCFDPALVVEADYSADAGDRAMAAVLEREPDVQAVVTASDLLTIGALRALRRSGRRCPEDVQVIGFADSKLLAEVEPAVLTVRQHLDRMTEEMVRLLRAQRRGHPARPEHVVLPLEFEPAEPGPGEPAATEEA